MNDREKLMGHAKAHMTAHYTHSDVVRRRRYRNEIASRLLPPAESPTVMVGTPDIPKDDPELAGLQRLFSLESENK